MPEPMIYLLTKPDSKIVGEITLPASKSISNRVLIINALSYSSFPVKNLSDCDDSIVMNEVLQSNSNIFDIGHAGTAMRFLTAYLSKIVGEWHLTGSERMQQRPISILVEALRKMGAQIEYTGVEGYPPLKITGTALKGGTIELDGQDIRSFRLEDWRRHLALHTRCQGARPLQTAVRQRERILDAVVVGRAKFAGDATDGFGRMPHSARALGPFVRTVPV